MSPEETLARVEQLLGEERARTRHLTEQLQSMELDTQRKEAVFEVMNGLLDATSEIVELARVAIAANKKRYGRLALREAVALDERIHLFDREDTSRYREDLQKVDAVFQIADSAT